MVWQKMLASVAGSALGKVAGKLADWVPSPEQHLRNKIDKLEREQDELKKQPHSGKRDVRLVDIADELRELHEKAKNK